MSLVRKGSRLITVNGVVYRWRIRRKPTYSQGIAETPLTFAVEHADMPGAPLVVQTVHNHPGNWMGAPAAATRPADVEAAIRAALRQGWQPALRGPVFHLDINSDGSPSE